jgi:hypothetical protein
MVLGRASRHGEIARSHARPDFPHFFRTGDFYQRTDYPFQFQSKTRLFQRREHFPVNSKRLTLLSEARFGRIENAS